MRILAQKCIRGGWTLQRMSPCSLTAREILPAPLTTYFTLVTLLLLSLLIFSHNPYVKLHKVLAVVSTSAACGCSELANCGGSVGALR